MNLTEHDRGRIDSFFEAVRPMLSGYNYSTFSYVAFKQDEKFVIAQARLSLAAAPGMKSGCFESQRVIAGFCYLNDQKLSAEDTVKQLLSGSLKIDNRQLTFPPQNSGNYSTSCNLFHLNANEAPQRNKQLLIFGAERRDQNGPPNVEWELRAAQKPFDSLQDLCLEYAIPVPAGSYITAEIIAFSTLLIGGDSVVRGTTAKLILYLAKGLQPENASLGYILFDKGKIFRRDTLSGGNFKWNDADISQRGEFEIEVPAGSVLHCFATFAGETQHHAWVIDPSTVQNPLRAAHQTFDTNLQALQEILTNQGGKGQNARELETAVGWVLWMLGFAVTHLGGTKRTEDAPDIVASTAQGHLVVIECTTGLLKGDNKLPKLVERAQRIRQSLTASGNSHVRVLPVIITTRTREEVKPDIEQATKSGVLVATREGFAELINRTNLLPNSDWLYVQAENELKKLQTPSPFAPHF